LIPLSRTQPCLRTVFGLLAGIMILAALAGCGHLSSHGMPDATPPELPVEAVTPADLERIGIEETWSLEESGVSAVARCPNGTPTALVVGEERVWMLATTDEPRQANPDDPGEIEIVAASRCGEGLAIGGGDSGRVIFADHGDRVAFQDVYGPDAVAMDPGGSKFAWVDGTGVLHLRSSGGLDVSLETALAPSLRKLHFCSSGDRIWGYSEDHIGLWDTGGDPIETYDLEPGLLDHALVSGEYDRLYLTTLAPDRSLYAFEEGGEMRWSRLLPEGGGHALGLSCNEAHLLVYGTGDGGYIALHDAADGAPSWRFGLDGFHIEDARVDKGGAVMLAAREMPAEEDARKGRILVLHVTPGGEMYRFGELSPDEGVHILSGSHVIIDNEEEGTIRCLGTSR